MYLIFSTIKAIFPNFYFLAAPPSAESPDQIPEGFSKCYKKPFDLNQSNHHNAFLSSVDPYIPIFPTSQGI